MEYNEGECEQDSDGEDTPNCNDYPAGYIYEPELCTCVIPFCKADVPPKCEDGYDISPIDPCECIPEQDIDAIYLAAELLGPNCDGEIDDEPEPDSRCEGYPAGWRYDDELCQCVSDGSECEVTCEGDFTLEPISKCGCLTISDASLLY